ncbi:HAD-IIB family hydrolase [Vibrio tapetis subsp. quintayensis]|uniref:HAD-IIB family hydrolase n=1 Tax=Vibrio tapetis TaxID=52443 RepID=UPI0025B33521|nr:HAD-IIB family hydrolase [Vibrio tapetis]MDN3681870.1 HAD-IIB family hydrolase [Vibrio tapetis subsp. quintayensis]
MIKMLVCDFDGTLDGGCSNGVEIFSDYVREHSGLGFVIATGRTLPLIKQGLAGNKYPLPRTIISDVGTQIHHGHQLSSDSQWQKKLHATWNKPLVHHVLSKLAWLGECNPLHQGPYKCTFEGKLDENQYRDVVKILQQFDVAADLTYSHDWYLDVTPKGINKASAIHHLMAQNNLTADEVCVAGDSANDTAMLSISGINSILVANHYPEVAHLSKLDHVYTSKGTHAEGVLEGLKYWQDYRRNA